jgi:hypothetical protein
MMGRSTLTRLVGRGTMLAASVAAGALGSLALGVACSSSSDDGSGGGGTMNADTGTKDALSSSDAAATDDADAAAAPGTCASKFGTALTEGFGRIDGVVHAVQKPSDTSCAMPDPEHVVVQVLMNGDVYRMVVDVGSSRDTGTTDTKVRFSSFPHAMPAPDYEEGWRTGIPLDYANLLGAHSADGGFATLGFDEATAKIVAAVKVGDPVSVYSISAPGHPESAEMVHRNMPGTNMDGAIVLGPTSGAPTFLLFHFADQTF